MNKYFKYGLIAVVVIILIYFFQKMLTTGKYKSYLKELGFNIADRMEEDEIKTSYIYLHDYARVYKDKASQILRAEKPDIWNKAKEISIKYKIFNL